MYQKWSKASVSVAGSCTTRDARSGVFSIEPKIPTLYSFKICTDYKRARQVRTACSFLLVVHRILLGVCSCKAIAL